MGKRQRQGSQGDNPQAATLAEQFGVSKMEIQTWIEKGFEIGQVERVYRSSKEWNVAPGSLFGMLENKKDWGEIEAAYRRTPDHVDHAERPRTPGERLVPGGARRTQRGFYVDNAVIIKNDPNQTPQPPPGDQQGSGGRAQGEGPHPNS